MNRIEKDSPRAFFFFKTIFSILVFCGVFLCIVFIYQGSYKGKIYPGVYLENHKLSAMNHQEFMEKFTPQFENDTLIIGVKANQLNLPIPIEKRDQILESMWDDFYDTGREDRLGIRLVGFSKRLFIRDINYIDNYVPINFFSSELFSSIESDSVLDRVFDGNIDVTENALITIEHPKKGEYIDKIDFEKRILRRIILGGSNEVLIPTKQRDAIRNDKDIDSIADTIKSMMNRTIEMRHPRDERLVELDTKDIQSLVSFELSKTQAREFSIIIDIKRLQSYLEKFEVKNAQAKLEKNGTVSIIPSQSGILADMPRTLEFFEKALRDPQKVDFVVVPEAFIKAHITTEDLQSLGLRHVISEFTTYHDCCAARVENIHLVADKLDGTIINPGETLDVNKFLGERKSTDGFKPAGAIFEGELVDSVGGGISQFITTLHNAVYWGGYEMISHKAHSIYFSRYPMGIEATINWPYLDYVFKNNTNSGIMIDTEYTDTSITVRFLGFNGGRIIKGDQKNGMTNIHIIQEGNNESRKVSSTVSDPYNFKPPIIRYISDAGIPRGESYIQQTGGKGWTVRVHREVLGGDTPSIIDDYPVAYRSAKDTIVRINTCDNPEEKKKPSYCFAQQGKL